MEILVRVFGFAAHFQIGKEAEPEVTELTEEPDENTVVNAIAEPELAETAQHTPMSGFRRSNP